MDSIVFPSLHNDDLIPVADYNGITVYEINHEQAAQREAAYRARLIQRSE